MATSPATTLSAAKRALLARQLQGGTPVRSTLPAVGRRDPGTPVPCTMGQRQVWLATQVAAGEPVYNESITIRRTGPVDVDAFRRAFNLVVSRHEAWRTTFTVRGGEPFQVVHPHADHPLPLVDLVHLPAAEREAEAVRMATVAARAPYDLEAGPLVRPLLVRLEPTDHRLYLALHHLVFDGVSVWQILLGELAAAYDALVAGEPVALPEPALQIGDHACWEREHLTPASLESRMGHWRRVLAGEPPVLQLPTDRPRPPRQSHRGAARELFTERPVVDALRELARQEGASLYMVLLSAFGVLLHRHTGQDTVLVAAIVDGRRDRGLEGTIGFLVNPVPVRIDLSGDPSFRELLGRVREAFLTALAHEVPFPHLLQSLPRDRDLSRNPIVQASFSLEPPLPPVGPEWEFRDLDVDTRTSRFDIALLQDERPHGLLGALTYSTDVLDAGAVGRMAGHWATLLAAIAGEAGCRVSELPLLTEPERRRLLAEGNDSPLASPAPGCIHELVEEQARRRPGAVAVVQGDRQLSYGQLVGRARRLAARLRAAGVGREALAGVCLERSPEMVVAVLAVLMAGGAYVPLDPAYPPRRIAFVLDDARAAVLVTRRSLLGRLPRSDATVICVDADGDGEALAAGTPPSGAAADAAAQPGGPDSLAYVMYTSGSTGMPKGVMIEHGPTVNHIAALIRDYRVGPGDAVLQLPSLAFQASVRDLLGTLCAGARLVLLDEDGAGDPLAIVRAVARHRVTCLLSIVPSLLRAVLDDPRAAGVAGARLRLLLSTGEPLRLEDARRATERFGCAVANQFGPTEIVMACCKHTVTEGDGAAGMVPIGRADAGARLYVLDAHRGPVPPGVAGELYVGGYSLARGYLRRPELTAERFLPDPFAGTAGARMYRTGDLVRRRGDGNLEFLGRVDDQVKVRGYRVEPGEVEAALVEHPSVREAAVAARPDPSGDRRLVAYVIARPGGPPIDPAALRRALAERLPDHMVPSAFAELEALPRTASGKLDRRALAARGADLRGGGEDTGDPVEAEAPASEVERALEAIWARALGRPRVGRHENFFDLGGHSLMAARLLATIEEELGGRPPLALFFRSGLTIAGTARILEAQLAADLSTDEGGLLVPIRSGRAPALFCVHSDESALLAVRHYVPALGRGRAVHGLLPPRTGRRFDRGSSIEQMSLALLDEVLRVQPEGPYLLVGHSLGGLLAYELARALRARGHDVALLGMVDAFTPQASARARRERMALRSRLRRQRDRGLRLAGAKLLEVTRRELSGTVARARGLSGAGGATAGEDWYDYEGAIALSSRYRPAGQEGPLLVLAAEASVRMTRSGTLGWEDVHRGPIEAQVLPGNHLSLLQEPHVGLLAAAIAGRVREAEALVAAATGRRIPSPSAAAGIHAAVRT